MYQKVEPFRIHSESDKNEHSWIYAISENPMNIKNALIEPFDRNLFRNVTRWAIRRWKKGETGIPLWVLEILSQPNNIDYVYCIGGQKFRIPNIVDEKLGLILGIHCADGSLTQSANTWQVTDKHRDSLEWLQKTIKENYNLEGKITKKGNGYRYVLESKPFYRFLTQICKLPVGRKSSIIREPKIIKKSPLTVRKSFVNGVIGSDGTTRIDRRGQRRIVLEIRSKQLRDDIAEILKLLEIKFSISERTLKSKWGEGILHGLTVSGNIQTQRFLNEIGLWHLEKLHRLNISAGKGYCWVATPHAHKG